MAVNRRTTQRSGFSGRFPTFAGKSRECSSPHQAMIQLGGGQDSRSFLQTRGHNLLHVLAVSHVDLGSVPTCNWRCHFRNVKCCRHAIMLNRPSYIRFTSVEDTVLGPPQKKQKQLEKINNNMVLKVGIHPVDTSWAHSLASNSLTLAGQWDRSPSCRSLGCLQTCTPRNSVIILVGFLGGVLFSAGFTFKTLTLWNM